MEPDITLKDFLREILEPMIDECFTKALNKYINSRQLEPQEYSSIFNLEEAAKYLKLSKPTMYAMTNKRVVPHFKQGKHLYFRKEELDQWLNKGRVPVDDFQAASHRYHPV